MFCTCPPKTVKEKAIVFVMAFRIIVISGNMEQLLLYDGAAYTDV